jgi:RNA polymerase sigma factor (sigma-70 family)
METDEALLAAAAGGDDEAFSLFYRRYVAAVTTFFRRRTPSAEVAFDLTAETFAAVAEGLGGYRAEAGSGRSWLFAIALNELRQAWRSAQVEDRARRRVAIDPIELDDLALRRVEEMVDDGALLRALRGLSDIERRAIELRVLGERDYGDIAGELGCSASVVRQRVSRGLRRLRTATTEEPG